MRGGSVLTVRLTGPFLRPGDFGLMRVVPFDEGCCGWTGFIVRARTTKAQKPGSKAEPLELPPELAAEIHKMVLAKIRSTLDEPIPQFKGKTLRQVARSAKSRPDAISWLRQQERLLKSNPQLADLDMRPLWQELALPFRGSKPICRADGLVTLDGRAILWRVMPALPADAPLSYDEYLRFEASVDSRHEFIDGDIFAMAGGTRRHAVLKSRLSARIAVGPGERAACRVEDSDTRIAVERGANLNAYYPDMVVICGEGQTHASDPDGGVVNPRLIAEVTSPNTEKRDRGVKLDDYRLIPSLANT